MFGECMKNDQSSAFTVTEMKLEDVEEATKMRLQSWRDTYVNDEAGVTADWLDGVIIEQMSDEKMRERRERGGFGWVARNTDGDIIGVSMPFVMDDGTQRLGGMYVDKDWHGKSVGSALMQKVINFHDPTKPIVLGVASYNERAKAFYRKWGFEEMPNSIEKVYDKIPTVRMIRKATR